MKIEKYTSKLVGNDEERAVSPVIGVILMVAITVILAAVIAAFVLDLGQSTGANPQAGITFDESGSDVTVKVNNVERADSLSLQGTDECEGFLENNQPASTDSNTETSRDLSTDAGSRLTIHFSDSYDEAGSQDVGVDYICASDDTGSDAGSAVSSGTIQVIGTYDGNDAVVADFDI